MNIAWEKEERLLKISPALYCLSVSPSCGWKMSNGSRGSLLLVSQKLTGFLWTPLGAQDLRDFWAEVIQECNITEQCPGAPESLLLKTTAQFRCGPLWALGMWWAKLGNSAFVWLRREWWSRDEMGKFLLPVHGLQPAFVSVWNFPSNLASPANSSGEKVFTTGWLPFQFSLINSQFIS